MGLFSENKKAQGPPKSPSRDFGPKKSPPGHPVPVKDPIESLCVLSVWSPKKKERKKGKIGIFFLDISKTHKNTFLDLAKFGKLFEQFWRNFDFGLVMLTIPDLTSRVESSQQGTKPESSRVEESTPE